MSERKYIGGPRRPPLPIIPFEAIDSYIARVAARENLSTAMAITGKIGLIYGHLADVTLCRWEQMPALAEILGIDASELTQRCYPPVENDPNRRSFFGCSVHRRDIDLKVRNFTPSTFRIQAASCDRAPHIPAISQIRLFPFCEISWEMLNCKCPRCGVIQRWHHTNGIDRCDVCVCDLAKAAGISVPEELRENLSAAVGLIHPDPDRQVKSLGKLPAELRDEGSSAAFELLVRLLPVVDNSMPRHRQRVTKDVGSGRVTRAVAGAWDLMAGWPDGFDRFASARVAERPCRKGDGNNGATVNFLRSAHVSPNIVPRSMHRAFVRYDATDSGNGPSDTLTIREAAAELGMSTNEVIKRRRAGGLRPRFCLIRKRALPLYDRPEVKMLRAAMSGSAGIGGLADMLGVSVNGCEQLAATGLVTPLKHPFFSLHYRDLRIDRKSIAPLIDRLYRARNLAAEASLISLSSAVKGIGGRPKPWGPILLALLDGQIPFAIEEGPSRLARRIRVHRGAIRTLAALTFDQNRYPGFKFADHMSKRDAGEALNLSCRDYTPLLADPGLKDGPNGKSVAEPHVRELSAHFISPIELSHRTNIPLRTLEHRAKRVGLEKSPAGFERTRAEEEFKSELN